MADIESLELNPKRYVSPMPEEDAIGRGLTVVKLGAMILPPLAPVAILLDLLIAPRVNQRMTAWYEDVCQHLNDLIERVDRLSPESLGTDEAFVSAFLQATQSAVKTHQASKREALRNAVLNVAIGKEPNPNRQHQFLTLVDRLSEAHLYVLKFLNNPSRYFQLKGEQVPHLNHVQGTELVNQLVARAFPELSNYSADSESSSFQFLELILGDLNAAQLVAFERHQDTWAVPAYAIPPGGGPIQKMTKQLGDDFLAFIAEPEIGQGL